jgi:hypothetical protein
MYLYLGLFSIRLNVVTEPEVLPVFAIIDFSFSEFSTLIG